LSVKPLKPLGFRKLRFLKFVVKVHGAHWWHQARRDKVREYLGITGKWNTMTFLEVLYAEKSMNFIFETNHQPWILFWLQLTKILTFQILRSEPFMFYWEKLDSSMRKKGNKAIMIERADIVTWLMIFSSQWRDT
jgi:hypothetical protein